MEEVTELTLSSTDLDKIFEAISAKLDERHAILSAAIDNRNAILSTAIDSMNDEIGNMNAKVEDNFNAELSTKLENNSVELNTKIDNTKSELDSTSDEIENTSAKLDAIVEEEEEKGILSSLWERDDREWFMTEVRENEEPTILIDSGKQVTGINALNIKTPVNDRKLPKFIVNRPCRYPVEQAPKTDKNYVILGITSGRVRNNESESDEEWSDTSLLSDKEYG